MSSLALKTMVPASPGSGRPVSLEKGPWKGWSCSPGIRLWEENLPHTITHFLFPCRATPTATESLNLMRTAWAAGDGYVPTGTVGQLWMGMRPRGQALSLPALVFCPPPDTLPAPASCACPFCKSQVEGHVLGKVPRDSRGGGKRWFWKEITRTTHVIESLTRRSLFPHHLVRHLLGCSSPLVCSRKPESWATSPSFLDTPGCVPYLKHLGSKMLWVSDFSVSSFSCVYMHACVMLAFTCMWLHRHGHACGTQG